VALLLAPALLLVLGVIAYPLLLAVRYSLSDATIGDDGRFVGLQQYAFLARDPEYRAALWHTALYTGLSLVLKLGLGTAVALALATPFRGRRAVYAALLLPLLFPVVMDSITWYFLFSTVHGAFNEALMALGVIRQPYAFTGTGGSAMLTLVVINVWHGTPLVVMLALAGLQAVPADILDSARVDGARALARFRHVQLPSLVPPLALAALLGILGTFGDYAIVHLVTAGGPGGETHIVSSLAFAEALRGGSLATGIAMALAVVPGYLVALLLVMRLVLRP
jgi:multiple sugar transport system permease protein